MSYSEPIPYLAETAAYFQAIADLPWAIWLDSAGRGRYEIMTAQPLMTLVTHGGQTVVVADGASSSSAEEPFALLRKHLAPSSAAIDEIPFAGGAVGYWGYDLARRFITLPETARDGEGLPEMAVGIYDWALVIDHQRQTAQLVSHRRAASTEQVLQQVRLRIQSRNTHSGGAFETHGEIGSNLGWGEYQAAFGAVQRYLHAGDCYQVNLARRMRVAATGDALPAYLELRRLSPAPYSAFLKLPQVQILCASPERFLQVRRGMVETKPIKGTRPRLADLAADMRIADELRTNAKDRAENLMIVDLLRNDLGKSCVPGSVSVPKLFEIESYSNVHHLVSTVRGQLASDRDALAMLRDCFPGGSVTGAPKQRAMEIIEQLEPNRRGVYCGALGYIGFDGNMDTNIAIRTLVYSGGEIRFWVGGGIVADSRAEAEYQETLDKASAMLALLSKFGAKIGDGVGTAKE